MKPFYFLIFIFFLQAGCIPTVDQKSVLQFHVNKRTVASTPVANLEQVGLAIRMGDRYYVSSLLLDIFGPTADAAVSQYIKVRMDYFGGGCDQYAKNLNLQGTCLNDDCPNTSCSGISVIDNQIGVSSVIRQGWTMKACEEITNNNNSILYVVQNLYGKTSLTATTVPAPNNEMLIKSYSLFYRTGSPSNAIISSLANITTNETANNFEKWRYVLLGICTTSEWQIP